MSEEYAWVRSLLQLYMGGLEMEQQFMPHGSSGWAAILCPGPDGGNYLMSHAHIYICIYIVIVIIVLYFYIIL